MKITIHIYSILIMLGTMASCTNNLPQPVDSLGEDISFNQTEYKPTLGRTTVYKNNVNFGTNSTLPVNFKIVNIRTADLGKPATELTSKFPVQIWKEAYTGTEKTYEEIEAKKAIEYRALFEIQEKSGELTMWHPSNSNFVKASPSEGYIFDVEIANSGC